MEEKDTATDAVTNAADSTDTMPSVPTAGTSTAAALSNASTITTSTAPAPNVPNLTSTQRKNAKRCANEEARKKDNQRIKAQRKKAAAVKKAGKGEVADLFVHGKEDGDGEDAEGVNGED